MARGRTFKFRLEALGNYRQRLLDLCEQALAEAHRVVSDARKQHECLYVERIACREAITAAGPDGRLNADDMKDMDERIRFLGYAIARQRTVVRHRERDVEDRRLEVVDASKKRKTVERLRERDYARFVDELNCEERRFLDEVGSIKAARAGNANIDGAADLQRVTQ